MSMNLVKSALAVAALAVGSTVANAAIVGSTPVPIPDSGNGGLIFYAYDDTRNVSLVWYLGSTIDTFLPGSATADVDFGTLPEWNTVFGASTLGNIHWSVTAGDRTPTNGNFNGARLATTAGADPTGNVRNSAMRNALTNVNGFLLANIVTQTCNPCTAADLTEGDNAAYLGDQITDSVGGPAVAFINTARADAAGSSLGFYLISGGNTTSGTSQAGVAAYAGVFELSALGNLLYNAPDGGAPVPLPAAAWLLLSGLAGFGVVGRRRGQNGNA